MYAQVLGRAPTAAESASCTSSLSTMGLSRLSLDLAHGAEAQSAMRRLFEDVLARQPSGGEMENYLSLLAQDGMGRTGVKALIESSGEAGELSEVPVLKLIGQAEKVAGSSPCDQMAAYPSTCNALDGSCFASAREMVAGCL
jgi:hypothetical protein